MNRGYVICSEPRSGTNLLCQLLESTGKLGHPLEYFNADGRRAHGRPDYPDDPESQFAEVLASGVGDNGIYGVKVFTEHFDRVAHTRWTQRLPNLHFVHLERTDYLAQAISAVRAEQTGQYRSTHAPTHRAEPHFDAPAIAFHVHAIARGHARWRIYFARRGIAPLYLTYDAVAAEPQRTVQSIADLIGLGEPVLAHPAKVEVQVQRDTVNDQWRAQFLQRCESDPTLDHLRPSGGRAWLHEGIDLLRERARR